MSKSPENLFSLIQNIQDYRIDPKIEELPQEVLEAYKQEAALACSIGEKAEQLAVADVMQELGVHTVEDLRSIERYPNRKEVHERAVRELEKYTFRFLETVSAWFVEKSN